MLDTLRVPLIRILPGLLGLATVSLPIPKPLTAGLRRPGGFNRSIPDNAIDAHEPSPAPHGINRHAHHAQPPCPVGLRRLKEYGI
ncbi:MAG: hypothetical protein ACOYKN_18375 [Pirellula sp.]